MTYPYVLTTGKFKEFLAELPRKTVPPKVTIKWLKSLGYTSSNHESFPKVLKFVGLIDDSNVPTPLWATELRGNPKAAMAKAIRQGYAELFAIHDDAPDKDNEALRNFFNANTTVGEKTVSAMVLTFKALAETADFGTVQPSATETANNSNPAQLKPKTASTTETAIRQISKTAEGLTININVQLQVPPDATGDIYDKFFEAMKKHLIDGK